MIRLIEQRANIVFVDEACFTSNQIRARYWAKAGDASLKIDKAKIGFKCIAVVGAINVQGRVVALLQRTLLFSIHFPGRKLSISKLRRVYRLNQVKLRVMRFNQ